jgi:urease accessory protein
LRSEAILAVAADGRGGTRINRLRAEPPIALRQTGPDEVTLVGSAGGPLGGDDLRLRIDVSPGARLRVRSAAATVALPGRAGTPSRFRLDVQVGPGGWFAWTPEPTVAARRARHEITVGLRLETAATAMFGEVLVLGRLGEPPGTARSRLEVTVEDRPLLRQETLVGADGLPGWAGPAGLGGARVIGTQLVAGAGTDDADLPGATAQRSCCRLAGPGMLVTAWGADALAVGKLLGCDRTM